MPAIRTLLVEDEKDIQFIVKLALERSGRFEVTTFDNGDEALAHLSTTPDRYDLALTNFRLPGMHGLEFIHRMQSIPPFADLPAIGISAALLDRELTAYTDAGVLGVISKPFDIHGLPQQVLDLYTKQGG
ncbi:response regulator [Novosphingobium sp. JCM 18896]|uniref:response regulator n=1 Tax=Novosphingobium sp. JCM 18896 TaxID=2989731 RepID=UPI0022213854|nr:response regulator [Novosphingobium sp. JCM 18896]MCW1430571.1 response regulator [Novosphingobium sp. JCM 18896]